ncbi:MAG TPA: YtxH domain-containing protein [Candidatus Dormibacteraeota bacterium]|nr:YtxH domain-containing protein [Candidatus Dormibacteraeota bacterium]
MGYLKGFGHGIVVGAVVGVLLAPRPGRETRALLEANYRRTKRTSQGIVTRAQSGWLAAQPALSVAKQVAGTAGRAVEPLGKSAGLKFGELTGRSRPQAPSGPFFATSSSVNGDGS